MGDASLRPSDSEPLLRLDHGERLRATVLETPEPKVAILGLVGCQLRVRLERRVQRGDELLVVVEHHGEVVRLRCIQEDASDGLEADRSTLECETRASRLDTRA
ncbi:MAG: hypothetical protein H6832_00830 [Planctomycetes bacterium]|nr:hypothetical protein [Planctomycetota bacterium]MCB9916928.1 hypothetical protein [Planctomycetota bacterium]